MFKQYPDFDVKNFMKTFNSHSAYNGRLNGFDVMIMQSQEDTDEIIEKAKSYILKEYNILEVENWINEEIKNKEILEPDQIRIKEELEKFINLYI